MSEPIADSALVEAALDAARVLDDFVGHVVGVNDGRIGGWDDAQKGWRRAFAGNRVFGQKHVVQGMGAAFSGEQLRKASVEARELVTAIEALRSARSEVAVRAAIDAVELGVDEFPATLADDSLSSRSPQIADLYQRLSRVIGVLSEARTKTLLAEMRVRTADPPD